MYSKKDKIFIGVKDGRRIYSRIFIISLLLITILAFVTFDYKNLNFSDAIRDTIKNFISMFSKLTAKHYTFKDALNGIGITLSLAFLTTLIGSVISFFLAIICARNLANKHLSNFIYKFIAVIRAVPTILWVLIFAISIGLGSEAAVIGMSFHTIGYLTKAYAESFERVSSEVIEGIKSTGATQTHILFKGVIPSSLSSIAAWTLMRFEINFANAIAMGAAAGAGGIGFDLFMSSRFYFNIGEVGYITLLLLIVVVVLEYLSTLVKNKYLH